MSGNLAVGTTAPTQTDKVPSLNTDLLAIASAVTETHAANVSAGNVTLTNDEWRRHAHIRATGAATAGRTVTVPAIERLMLVTNASGTHSVAFVRGTTSLTVAPNGKVLVWTDGTANGLFSALQDFGTISQQLDTLGSTRGAIAFRGASAWNILAPGTVGHVLTSQGAGADPIYAGVPGGGGGGGPATIWRPVIEVNRNTPPVSPSTGDIYAIGPSPTGAWVGNAGSVAEWGGSSWTYTVPAIGSRVHSAADTLIYRWSGSAWSVSGGAVRPTIVQTGVLIGNTGSITLGAAPTAGNLLIVLATRWSSNVGAPSGAWATLIFDNGTTNDGTTILSRFVGSGESATQTILGGTVASGVCATVYEIAGAAPITNHLAVYYDETGGTTGTLSIPVPSDNALVVGHVVGYGTTTPPTSITNVTLGTNVNGTRANLSPSEVTPFSSAGGFGAISSVATYAATKNKAAAAVVIGPRP